MKFTIVPERPADAALLDPLLDRTVGFDRQEKTVYRLRDGVQPVAGLSFSAITSDGELLASLRFWPVCIGEAPAILLGPLAVEPPLQGLGLGRGLMRHGLTEAKRLAERICLVVGEPEYYGPFGFVNAGGAGLILPGPVEAHRFQVLEITPGALDGVSGLITRAEAAPSGSGLRSDSAA